MNVTKERLHLAPKQVRPYAMDAKTTTNTLDSLGISYSKSALDGMKSFYAMDADIAGVTTPSVSTPIQFLQHWLPDVVEVVTAAREIDAIAGRSIVGRWEDEEIVQRVLERTGQAKPYGDHADIPLSSWNLNFEHRDIVRFEQGIQVGVLEEARAGAMNVSSQTEKRAAAAEALAIELNNVGFYGYNATTNRTYGLLNDPNLGAYTTVAAGTGGGTTWASKTYDEICLDIKTAMAALRTKSGNHFKPERDAAKLAVAVSAVDALNAQNQFGMTVFDFIKKNYPNVTVESAVQLDGANGGANVFYLIADTINGGRVIDQLVPDVFRLVGTEKKSKVFIEDYSNATAGILVKRPIGVVRYSGI